MSKKKSPKKSSRKAFMEEAQAALIAGTVFTLTPEEQRLKQLEMKAEAERIEKAKKKAFLKSSIISTLMMYNLDELHDLGATDFKLKQTGKRYHIELERYLDSIFDLANDIEAAKYISDAVKLIETMLEQFTSDDNAEH